MRRASFLLCSTVLLGCSSDLSETASLSSESFALSSHESDGTDVIHHMSGADSPWGDYGRILIHGVSDHLGRKGGEDGPIQLERTGPFVPPITFPGIGKLIVTNEMKEAMEKAGFRGISFRLVEKTHISNVPWHEWDLTAAVPRYYPDGGEPEGYVLHEPHSPELAEAMGSVWEVVLTDSAEVVRETDPVSDEIVFKYVPRSWNGNDIFSVSENSYTYVSPRAKAWLKQHAGKWVEFQSVTAKSDRNVK